MQPAPFLHPAADKWKEHACVGPGPVSCERSHRSPFRQPPLAKNPQGSFGWALVIDAVILLIDVSIADSLLSSSVGAFRSLPAPGPLLSPPAVVAILGPAPGPPPNIEEMGLFSVGLPERSMDQTLALFCRRCFLLLRFFKNFRSVV